jgi:hypothetical protein
MPSYFFIKSAISNLVIDIKGASTAPVTPLIAYPRKSTGTDNQLWYIDADGYIVSKLNGYVIDIKGGVGTAGTELIAYPKNSPQSKNQLWSLQGINNPAGGYIVSALNNLVIDIKGGGTPAPGTPLIAYTRNNPASNNQLWSFVW